MELRSLVFTSIYFQFTLFTFMEIGGKFENSMVFGGNSIEVGGKFHESRSNGI